MQVAYHGAPEKAYEIFVNALLSKQLKLSSLKDKNPAGIMTLLHEQYLYGKNDFN